MGDEIRNSPWVRKFLRTERPAGGSPLGLSGSLGRAISQQKSPQGATIRLCGPFRVAGAFGGKRPASGMLTQWKPVRVPALSA
jgi:hypothetical protein